MGWGGGSGCLCRVEARLTVGPQRPLSSVNRRPSPDLFDWQRLTLEGWN